MVYPGFTLRNKNGGLYVRGRQLGFERKMHVKDVYVNLLVAATPKPSIRLLAKESGVSRTFAKLVVDEIVQFGDIVDPKLAHARSIRDSPAKTGKGAKSLTVAHEIFLLALRSMNPFRPLHSYVNELYKNHGVKVSMTTISHWITKRFDFHGRFRKPNLIPIDKYRAKNILRYVEFMEKKEGITDHRRFNFLDEKHIVNKDTVPDKVRQDPLTGRIDSIGVSGDFRKRYNLQACIATDETKGRAIAYTISENNGNADSLVVFIESMIVTRFLRHNEAVVMDNATIHYGGRAAFIEDLLWYYVVDGRPLNILVIYLPTRSPELNPIELVFHILAKRAVDWRCYGSMEGRSIVKNTTKVLDNIDFPLIHRCCRHCGYNF